ncbi:hypothetical protein FACS189473_2030 [Spirochaetia bacterium]|nr:hypothetical protein FACS189473_2030 [Spirochaetia bacterium]
MKRIKETGLWLVMAAAVLAGGCSLFMGDTGKPEPEVTVSSLKVARSTLNMKAGGLEYVDLIIAPANSQDKAKITWEWDPEIISCTADNYGVVVRGLKAGSSTLVARSGTASSTAIVNVTGTAPETGGTTDPYLYSDYHILELKPGVTQKISASLYGGSAADAGGFNWSIDKPNVAELSPAGQYCHILAKEEGAAQITVTHPNSPQAYSILIYVFGDEGKAAYITTTQNIVTAYVSSGDKTVSVDLMNPADANYKALFNWQVTEGESNITLLANGTSAIITPVKSGNSTIRVSHPAASYPQDILVRVIELVHNVFIEPDATIVTVNGSAAQTVSVKIAGTDNASDEFTWDVSNPDVADTLAVGNQILITGKKNGWTKITISHPAAPYSREIMVLVRNQAESAVNASMYVTTSQNYVRTKVGQEGTPLNVSLVGGVPGDEANFTWEVSDRSIIHLETTHGTVTSRSIFDSRSNGSAYIDGLSEGTAVVTVTHPKILTPTEILVKVLPAAALLAEPFYLLGENIIGIVVGQQKNTGVVLSGNGKTPSDAAGIRWGTDNANVVTVSGSGEAAVIRAVSVGETYITVSHSKVEVPKRILVYTANTQEELAAMKLIYTTKNYHVLAAGQTAKLRLGYTNLTAGELSGIWWTIDNPAAGSIALGADNTECIVTGLNTGTAKVTAQYPSCAPVVFDITVLPAGTVIGVDPATGEIIGDPAAGEEIVSVNTNYISGESIIGIVVGQQKNTAVKLAGKNVLPSDSGDLLWTSGNSGIVEASGAGESGVLRAVSAGQTYITVSHAKVEAPKKILVYTANTEEELLAMKLIYTTKNYHVLAAGKTEKLRLGYNNLTASEISGIQWSSDNASVASYSLGADNTECMVTGVTVGTAKITAQYPSCAPVVFDITVLPAGTVISVDPATGVETGGINTNYLSGESIIGIVVGRQKNTAVKLAGKNILPSDTADLIWTTENSGIVTVSGAGESGVLRAVSAGQAYITVSHAKVDNPKKILVYTANTEEELLAMKLIYTTKNYHVLAAGQTAKLRLGYNNLTASEISGIQWSIDNASAASYSLGADNTECIVTGLNTGTAKVTARHALCTTPVVFDITVLPAGTVISVDPATGVETGTPNTNYISGESIIGIVAGQQKNTAVKLAGKNILPSDTANLIWTTENSGIVTVSGAGESGVLRAVSAGQAYITVSHAKVDNPKKILVYTANTAEELAAMKLLYSVKTGYTIMKGSKETLYLNYVNIGPAELSGIRWHVSDTTVASITMGKNNSEAVVTGLREGSTAITASHPGTGTPVTITIDVVSFRAAVGTVAAAPIFFTTAQNVVQFTAAGANKEVTVTPVNLSASEYHLIDWAIEDSRVCTIVPNGSKVTITAKAPGETVIRVSHDRAENVLKITVRVGEEYIYNNPVIAYISTSLEVVPMVAGSPDSLIEAALVNSGETSGFTFSIDRSSIAGITAQFSTGKCFIKPLAAGQAELTIHHGSAAFDKKVVLVVGNTREEIEGFTYLSTAQNVVTVAAGSTKTVNVSVQGAKEAVISGYTWSTSNANVVNVHSTGATARLAGNGIGSAVVTVRQSECPYPLEIIVMVIDPVTAAANPYISSPASMYLLTVGQPWKTIEAELVGGSAGDDTGFLWSTPNTSLINLYGQGKTAMVRAASAGNAVITISHPKAQYTRSIRIICEEAVKTNSYISVPESIINLKPTDGAKTITATLINGAAEDRYNFRWFLDTYDVVELNYSANVASIRPLSQGQTTLRITHPNAAYEQQVIIKVSEYTTFSFGKDSQTITEGTIVFLPMQIPVTAQAAHVEYSTNSAAVVTIAGTRAVAQITGAGEGTAVVTAKLVATNTNAVQATAEMLVYCKKAESTLTYITTGTTVYTVEKNTTRNISAAIAGPDIIATDENSLHWQSSDPAVVKISGASTTGTATGKQINIQAVGAGECTITVSHDKSNSPLTLYFIVPGSDAIEIMLSRNYVTLETGKNTEIKATLKNGGPSDYNAIVWELSKTNGVEIGTLLGSGQTVAVYAQKPGAATLRASLPNGNFAECEVLIQAARQFAFSAQSVRLRPGAAKGVSFTMTPEDADITFTVTNDSYFTYTWSLAAKTVTITGMAEGTATLTGVTNYGTKASLTVICAWDYEFSIDKTVIQGEPRADAANPDKFVIPYTVNPANADIIVELTNSAIADYVVDKANKKIILTPGGEGTGTVNITAKNPDAQNSVIGTKTCALNFRYNKITLVKSLISRTGSFSGYNSTTNTLTLGDGETAAMSFTVTEPNVSYTIEKVTLSDPASPVQVITTGSNNVWQIKHPADTLVYEYLVRQDSWLTYEGTRLRINWQKHVDNDNVYSRAYIKDTSVSVKGYWQDDSGDVHLYLVRTAQVSQGGRGTDAPFVHISGSSKFVYHHDFFNNTTDVYPNLGQGDATRYSFPLPVRVLANITARRVSEAEFKANTDWYIPPQEWANDKDGSGVCAEYFINPAERVPVTDKTIASVASVNLSVTILRNGVRETYTIPVQVETRNCAYNQQ